MESDEELVRRAKEGDKDAFGLLVERHQKAVAGFLLGLVHDVDTAEECAQMAFLKAYESLGSFEERAGFKTWVSRIALNVARGHLRWARLRSFIPFAAGSEDEEGGRWEESLRGDASADELSRLEKRLEWERALAGLGRREREIAALRLEGYALNEIAGVLGISIGTVKSTLFAAVGKMRKRLA